jgi:hypothetical protein
MHWPAYWWVFPLTFFVLMAGMWVYALKRGPRGWRWWSMPGTAGSGYDDAGRRSPNGSGDSTLDVLNRRLAQGEIDKREYEEIRAAIADAE